MDVTDTDMARNSVINTLNTNSANPLVKAVPTPKERRQLQKAKAALEKKGITPPITTEKKPTQPATSPPPPTTKLPPPIVVTGKLEDFSTFKKDVLSKFKPGHVKLTSMAGKFKINTKDPAEHRLMLQALGEQKVPCFTNQEKGQKQISAIIKGLPKGIPPAEIVEDLQAQNITEASVRSIIKNNKETNAYQVRLPNTQENKKIWNISTLCFHKITTEAPYNKGFAICDRCLEYGHTAKYCHRPYRCRQCPGQHPYANCPMDTEKEKPFCQNCSKEGHRATYRGCSEYQKYEDGRLLDQHKAGSTKVTPRQSAAQQRLEEKRALQEDQNLRRKELAAQKIKAAARQMNISYADRSKQSRPTHQKSPTTWQQPAESNSESDSSDSEYIPSNQKSKTAIESIQHMFKKQQEQFSQLMTTVSNLVNLVTQLLSRLPQ